MGVATRSADTSAHMRQTGASKMNITEEVEKCIREALPGATVEVSGASGHFEIYVSSAEFEGKRIVQKQRMVYSAIKHLMAGNDAPVHAVDKMTCEVP
jgi:acid stress-induced BolA-like protein IbaG/YrbA